MATKQNKRRTRQPAEEIDNSDVLDGLEEEQIEELSEVLLQFGTALSKAQINRVKQNGDLDYCETVQAAGLTQDNIRDTWGPGKYRIKFLTDRNRFARTITVNLAARVNGAATMPAVNGQQSSSENFLQRHLAQQETLILALIAGFKPAPPLDIGSILSGVAAMMTNKGGSDIGTVLPALITAVAALKGNDGGMDLKKIRDIFGLMSEFSPKGQAVEENMYTVVKDLGQKAIETVKEWKGGPAPAQLAAPSEQMPGGELVNAAPAPDGGQRVMTIQDWILAQLAFLKSKAAAGKDVDAWIDYILDNDEEAGCAGILQAIESGATFETLLQFDAEIAQNPGLTTWFKALYDGLSAEIKSHRNNPPAMDTSGPAGHTTNPRSHEDTSQGSGEPASGPKAS